jgi:hypothetical protein
MDFSQEFQGEQADLAVVPQTYIWEVLDYNLGPDIG